MAIARYEKGRLYLFTWLSE